MHHDTAEKDVMIQIRPFGFVQTLVEISKQRNALTKFLSVFWRTSNYVLEVLISINVLIPIYASDVASMRLSCNLFLVTIVILPMLLITWRWRMRLETSF
jgi:hypothetical protein